MMQTFNLSFFVVMFDLLGITVCGLTILYLIRMNLLERRAVERSSDGGEDKAGAPGGLSRQPDGLRHPDPYQMVRQMAKMNMSPRDISQRVKIPRGEVELIVKFSKPDFAGHSRRA